MGVNSALAFAGDAAVKASSLAGLVIAARVLPTAQFGLLGAALAAASVLGAVFDGGLSLLVVRDGSRDRGIRRAILRAGFVARVPVLAVAALGAAAFGVWHGRLPIALLAVAYGALGALSITLLSLFRAAQNLALEAAQKLFVASLGLAAVGVALLRPSATSVLAALVSTQAFGVLLPLLRARRLPRAAVRISARRALRASAPLGFMSLATLVYYRAGTLVLATARPAADVAVFTVATTVAFGALLVPNAILTGLLPRLSAAADPEDRLRSARRGLRWTLVACLVLALALGGSGPWLLPAVFGSQYGRSALPFGLLMVGDCLIGVCSVVGCALIASGRTRPLVVQTGMSVVVNVAANGVLGSRFGPVGAAAASLVTELVALTFLCVIAGRVLPGLLAVRRTERLRAEPRVVSA